MFIPLIITPDAIASNRRGNNGERFVVFCAVNILMRTVRNRFLQTMKFKSIFNLIHITLLSHAILAGQSNAGAAAENHGGPQYSTQGTIATANPVAPLQDAVSYASVSQVNGLLAQLDTTSKTTQSDLAKLRVDKWKTDSSSKKDAMANVQSIERNLQNALPEMVERLRNAPEDMPAMFRLYRNLDALYDVVGNVVESAGAFGPKEDFQSLSNDLSSFEGTRKQLAERLETLAMSKEQEIARLRVDLKTAQAAIPAAPPKKVVVDDNEPPKKPVTKKKVAPKKPATTNTPASTPAQTPPAQQPQQ